MILLLVTILFIYIFHLVYSLLLLPLKWLAKILILLMASFYMVPCADAGVCEYACVGSACQDDVETPSCPTEHHDSKNNKCTPLCFCSCCVVYTCLPASLSLQPLNATFFIAIKHAVEKQLYDTLFVHRSFRPPCSVYC